MFEHETTQARGAIGRYAAFSVAAHAAALGSSPALEQRKRSVVFVGQCEALRSTVEGRSDLSHTHQASPEPVAVCSASHRAASAGAPSDRLGNIAIGT